MGYQWHNGRLLNDEEYAQELDAEYYVWMAIGGFLLPFLGLGMLGLGSDQAIINVGGFVVGGILGYAFNSFLSKLFKWLLIGGMVAGVVYILYILFS